MTATRQSCSIEVRGLVKAYGDNTVLEGIDLVIEPGEFLVLVGPSGCGKSTLLRCIAGLEDITSGDLLIDGKRSNDVHPKDRDLAMVFQSYALYPHMTVAENMGFSLTVRRMRKDDIAARVRQAAGRLGLEDLLDRHPRELSGGQRQRVAVGRAIVRQPRGFLFDEPLSNLDAALRGQMRVELKKLHQELGVTMIYVTHDQVEAMTLADRIALLEGGRLRQVGTPGALYETPNCRFVAGFIGSPPMNFLDARVEDSRLLAGGVEIPLDPAARETPGEVVMGIRPPELVVGGDTPGRLEARVEVTETLGFESYVHADVAGQKVVAQVRSAEARALEPGTEVTLGVAPSSVHLFDPESGEAIRTG